MTEPVGGGRRGRRGDAIVGGAAGLIGGVVTGALLAGQDAMDGAGFGVGGTETGFALYLAVSAGLGVGFGLVGSHERGAYAANIAGGVMLGLVRFIVFSLTLIPLVGGATVRWELGEVTAAFPALIAALGWGALTGFGFHVLTAWWAPRRPTDDGRASSSVRRRVVILGGGFGGVATAQRLEQRFARTADIEITIVSSSNYLLFTPMLAEVASSALRAEHISRSGRPARERASAEPRSNPSMPPPTRCTSARRTAAPRSWCTTTSSSPSARCPPSGTCPA